VPDRETDVGSSPLDPRSAGRSSRPYVFATILLGVLVVVAWLGRDRMRPVMAGHPAPDFEAVALDGTPVELSDYRGKVVLVNIWATWCRPCRAEMPSMEALYREFEGTDFEIVAVSVDAEAGERDEAGRSGASKARLADFARELDLTFPILHDPEGRIERQYRTTGVPESFLVDRDGVIVRHVAGATIWDHPRYRELVRRLLDG